MSNNQFKLKEPSGADVHTFSSAYSKTNALSLNLFHQMNKQTLAGNVEE